MTKLTWNQLKRWMIMQMLQFKGSCSFIQYLHSVTQLSVLHLSWQWRMSIKRSLSFSTNLPINKDPVLCSLSATKNKKPAGVSRLLPTYTVVSLARAAHVRRHGPLRDTGISWKNQPEMVMRHWKNSHLIHSRTNAHWGNGWQKWLLSIA